MLIIIDKGKEMDTKRVLSPIILVGLFAAFALVCLLVWLLKGRAGKLITGKMKLGAAIIAITGVSTGCPPVITCYDPMPQDSFQFDSIDYNDYSVFANLPNDSVLTGTVIEPTYNQYQFKVSTTDSQLVDHGMVQAVDGTFDNSSEAFKIILNPQIDAGTYQLSILPYQRTTDIPEYEVQNIRLKIK